ncbi:MAG TPA: hypothetical protein LFW11_01210 [Rickettsia endosymbiont of Proechinophthirus fluctus]|uniref:hypothetical protein n=1 Tax=Rickettsia endosymbiont of Proechinophthirus fluctus TaxID=1462733 RepID=UPI000789C995|nr:hypothetical protein [Rickettsia endosymbiont of Proechinophthirus fluctus]KYP98898.1 hypothetical protein BG75_01180 [Rickettsia endosymbiont of Proechinophthirus fluctus]HJD53999.1 hypothetical protein [Rickettsia endosymbiont of Proechinophthirus fluctus]
MANIGNKEAFKKEQKEVGILYGFYHANKNTKQTLECIRATINKHKSPLPHFLLLLPRIYHKKASEDL